MKPLFIVSLFALFPMLSFSREAKLDTNKRAQKEGWQFTLHVTERQFRKLKKEYRAEKFEEWTKKLSLLHNGMTAKEVQDTLKPAKVIIGGLVTGAGRVDDIVLDDTYFVGQMVSPETGEMIWVTGPIAITYDIQPDKKSP